MKTGVQSVNITFLRGHSRLIRISMYQLKLRFKSLPCEVMTQSLRKVIMK